MKLYSVTFFFCLTVQELLPFYFYIKFLEAFPFFICVGAFLAFQRTVMKYQTSLAAVLWAQ
jgi:hypothetical protein